MLRKHPRRDRQQLRGLPDAAAQQAVFFAVADLLNLEVDLLFFDTTSTCFETEHQTNCAATASPRT